MNRGRRAENIFSGKSDYQVFIALLKECSELWNVRISAFCLMPTHYHLLIQTPDANLSRCMRHLNGVYTQRYNRSHHCDGQLFRGRYKSILVDGDSYLLQLVRYIHRNPLRAGLVDTMDNYPWSSHIGYVSQSKKWQWLNRDFILSMLSPDTRKNRKIYRQFVNLENSEEISRIFERKKRPSLLGSDAFIRRIRDQFYLQKDHQEIPSSSVLAPDIKQIKDVVCRHYRVNESVLDKSQRGVVNEPRNVAIYLARQLRGDGLETIGREFGLKRFSSTGSAVQRVKKQIVKNKNFRERIEKIRREITKGQR
jgi:REP element-mobilizing transposase RayT